MTSALGWKLHDRITRKRSGNSRRLATPACSTLLFARTPSSWLASGPAAWGPTTRRRRTARATASGVPAQRARPVSATIQTVRHCRRSRSQVERATIALLPCLARTGVRKRQERPCLATSAVTRTATWTDPLAILLMTTGAVRKVSRTRAWSSVRCSHRQRTATKNYRKRNRRPVLSPVLPASYLRHLPLEDCAEKRRTRRKAGGCAVLTTAPTAMSLRPRFPGTCRAQKARPAKPAATKTGRSATLWLLPTHQSRASARTIPRSRTHPRWLLLNQPNATVRDGLRNTPLTNLPTYTRTAAPTPTPKDRNLPKTLPSWPMPTTSAWSGRFGCATTERVT